jgi:hypothetical protein
MSARDGVRRLAEAHATSFGRNIAGPGVEVTNLIVGDDRFAMQVLVKGAGDDAQPLPACVLYRVEDGVAVEIERYVDETQRRYPKELVHKGDR